MDKGSANIFKNRDKIILLTPLLFAIHNFEEALGMGKWIESNPDFMLIRVSANQFLLALMMLTLIGFIFTIYALLWNNGESFNCLMNGFVGLMFLNAFFPHIIGTLLLKQYTPGTLTSLTIYLPLGIYVFYKNLYQEKIGKNKFLVSIVLGCLIGVVLTITLLGLGKVIF